MKYILSLCVAAFLFSTPFDAAAGTITIRDSVYADSIYLFPFGVDKVLNPDKAFGPPDKQYAHLGPLGLGPLFDLMFTSSNGITALTIQDTATIYIWGQKDLAVDTSAAQVKFIKTDAEGVILYESPQYILNDTLTVIELTGKEYTYMEFTLTGTEFNPGSKAFLLDAILLVQNRDSTFIDGAVGREKPLATTKIVSSYPNPFVASMQPSTVTFHLDDAADAELKIYDVLGHEIEHLSMGTLGEGDHSVPVYLKEPQVYFARLFLDGVPVGSAYRLIAQ